MSSKVWVRWVAISVAVASIGIGAIVVTTRDGGNDEPKPTSPRGSGPFVVALSQGRASTPGEVAVAVVDGEPLGPDDIAAVVRRLPPFDDSDSTEPFRRPAETQPRPRVGATIDRPFGPAPRAVAPPPPDGPLEVVRHQPDGEVSVAPFLSVTFNQPMVPLATVSALEEQDVPVQVTPAVEGRWRWIGTRTLRFEPTGDLDHLPMATEYSVVVPAGTESQTGGRLAAEVRFSFATPAPGIVSFTPQNETVDTEPLLVALFDQRIDAAAVLDHVRLVAGDDSFPLRLASNDEIAADDRARAMTEEAVAGRWMVFRAVDPLPKARSFRVVFGRGTPSAEGPRTAARDSRHTFRTYKPLKVVDHGCGFALGCPPGSGFSIRFNNPLDPEAFDPATIEITPEVTAAIGAYGDTITINAATAIDTTYTVNLPATLRDTFGQTLGEPESIEFAVGREQPMLIGFEHELVTTDPLAERPSVSVTSVGHETLRVDVYEVAPADFPAYQRYRLNEFNEDPQPPSWPLVSSSTISVDGGGIARTETRIDLGDDLNGPTGHRVVFVSPTREFPKDSELYWNNRTTMAWVQVTGIGVDAFADDDELLAWATDLRDGTPMPDVDIRLAGTATSVSTDGDGLARLPLVKTRYLVARRGGDVAILPALTEFEWKPQPRTDEVLGFTFDDRGLYRPGETVHVKGWFRRYHAGSGRTTLLDGNRTAVWLARDAFGAELAEGTVVLSDADAFDLEIELPAGVALGTARVGVTVSDGGGLLGSTGVDFEIQEFRRPEFEVVTRAESSGPHLLTGPVTVAAVARYFSGGTLPDASTTWQVTTRTATYAPPNWSRFSFGEFRPWWIEDQSVDSFERRSFDDVCCGPIEEERAATYTGRTDATGTHYLQLDFEGDTPDLPITVSANAAVEDVNRQMFASDLELLVHPASLYVGLRSTRQFVRAGEALDIEAIVTDIDGAAVAGRPFTIRAARLVSEFENGTWNEVETDPQECEVTSKAEAVGCSFSVDVGGSYRITAIIADDKGGRNRSELTRWVSGAEPVPSRSIEQEIATVVPDRDDYAPGDTAELLVVAPFTQGHGVITVAAPLDTTTVSFELDDGSAVVEVPLTDAHVPAVAIQVDIAGQAPRLADDGTVDPDLPPRPAFATAQLRLPVAPVGRTLDVSASARERATEPGSEATVDVTVVGADGAPVADADVAVVVVDEAVLSLTGYELADPLSAMTPERSRAKSTDYLRSTLVLAHPEVFDPSSVKTPGPAASETTFATSGGGDDARGEAAAFDRSVSDQASRPSRVTPTAIEDRTNFDALAIFAPSVRTDAAGRATVTFELPDNLTRYRVMAIAADHGDRFGAGESTLTARLPLQVRPSAPRFANFGDRFEFPVVVQNQTDEAIVADVVLETANLALPDGNGRQVEVPANDRVEVRFPAAVDEAGTARFRVSVAGGALADSASGEFPVYTPFTTEAFATYGVLDDGAIAQPFLTPTDVVPQFGGLEVDTSSTAVQALTDAVVYLADYDYESADAFASRIIALTSLRDVFAAFGGPGVPAPDQVDDRIRADLAALVALQRDDGGFGFWDPRRDSHPYVSTQATEALVLARAAGFTVDESAYLRALDFIRNIEAHFPPEWDAQSRAAVRAYALHVRNRAGDRDPAEAEALYRERDLPLDALAWLWPIVDDATIDAEIEREILNRAHDTPATVSFAADYRDGTHLVLASDRRTDAIVLDALLAKRPASDLVPKVVAGLIGNQVNGRWNNIQENGFILVALNRYFATFEAQTPDFVARVWLGDTYAAEHGYAGRSIERQHTLVPMTELAGNPDIVVAKDGAGRLYYRLGLRYAPADLTLDPRDEGFVVDRIYEGTEEGDVTRDADGTWHIRPGATIRVRLTMVADGPHTNMALVDPLPAGLEAVNPVLAASPTVPPDENDPPDVVPLGEDRFTEGRLVDASAYWWGWSWYDHENLRDDRVEAFSAYLGAGVYEYTYVARATTPGRFVAPPTKAEEIYAPEVFGRSASDIVIVGP